MASGDELSALRKALRNLGWDKDFINDVAKKYGEVGMKNWDHVKEYLEALTLTKEQIDTITQLTRDYRPKNK